LYASMKLISHNIPQGLGTRNNDLIRLIVSRAEIDMAAISDEFEVAYGKTLVDYIRGDTSGGYRDALIAIVKGNSKYRY
uniref:Annexin n=1 Tax=Anisakis simplex TaxID=6269 RepID=A0A0M3IZV5_ANISI